VESQQPDGTSGARVLRGSQVDLVLRKRTGRGG